MSHSSAKQNCLHQFGSSATGQLFEPRSLSINEAVYRQAQITFSTADFWLGVTDLKDQKYRYESDGTEVSMDQGTNGMWADDQPNDPRYLKKILPFHFILIKLRSNKIHIPYGSRSTSGLVTLHVTN